MLGNQGALGATFILSRYAQAASMIAVIGMTSNFIAEMVSASINPSEVLVGTLSVVCIAVLYCAITVILFMDNLLPYFINAVIDGLFMIALIVVAAVIGKPLSFVPCSAIGDLNSSPSSAYSFASALSTSLVTEGGRVNFSSWIGTSRSTCLQMKSIWGFSIALCVLFFFSSVSTICLWKRVKSEASAEKGEA